MREDKEVYVGDEGANLQSRKNFEGAENGINTGWSTLMEEKYVNERNEEIPDYIVAKAIEIGCINHLYIYKEREYGGNRPAASIGCSKATRFRKDTNAESMKVPLGEGWVAFKSPSGIGSKSSSESKAEKHTSILCQVEDIFERIYHNKYKTYLTTHTSEYYKEAEKESERTFYHLKMYTTDPPKSGSNVKDPDIIVAERDEIQYVIEVKWGYLEDYPSDPTDLKSIFDPKELNEIISMIRKSKVCRVTGPHIQNGNKVNGNENIVDFNVHSNTKFLVVSDLRGLLESNPADFNSIKNQHKNYDNLFSICDIKEDVDTFCSLDAFLNENKNKSVIISSNSQKKSEQVFKDGDDERATKFAEELKNRVNKRKWNYLLEPIVYGAKQEYSRILRLFTYFEILWLICLGLEISLLAARDVITGKESIGFMIFVWLFLMGIICGSVYLIQFLWVKKVRKKQQIERQKIIGDYRGDKKMDACCAVCGKKSRIRYKLNKQYVCKECLKKGQEEYLRAVIEKWQECPICGSKEGFEIEVGLVSKLACKSCLAEWTLSRTMIGGEIKGIRLSKADSENRAVRYLLKKHPLEWWAEKKWTEERTGKEEAENKVTETKEEPVEKMEIGKYERLGKYLNGLKEKEVTLTFEQIEYILGFQLPSSARQYPAWWANDKTHSHAVKGWLNCGWQSRNLNFSEEIVQFFQVNKKAELKPEIPITIERYLDYHLKKTNEDVKKVFLALRNKILRLGDVEERIKKSEVSYNIKYRIIFADFFGFHQDHIWMYLKLNKEVEDPKGLTEYDETGFDIGFKRKLKLTKDTDIDYTLGLVKNAIKATTSRDIVKIGAEGEHEVEMPIVKKEHLIIERAIYDPCKRDFIERALPRMKEWINRHDLGAYWFAISIQNNSDKTIDEWGVGLETSSALKVKEARVEGMEYKIELHESYPELFKSKYIIGVPKEYGLVIPKGGAQRVYFKLRAEKPKTTYEIGGVFKSEISGDVPIRAKEFKYLCDAGVSPEAVKVELKKTFSGKDAARLALSFKTVQELDRMCDGEAKTDEYRDKLLVLKNYTEGFSDTFTNQVDEFSGFMKEEQLGYLDDEYKGRVRRFCTNLVDAWINEFLKG